MEVVDHDEIQPVPVHDAPRLCTEFQDAEAGRVIDMDAAFGEDIGRLGQVAVVVLAKEAVPQALQVDLCPGAEQTLHELLGAHFQTENSDRCTVLRGRMLRDVHGKRRLSHRGAGRDDDHLARVHAVRHLIQLGVAGRQSGDHSLVLVEFLDGIDGIVDVGLDVREGTLEALLPHRKDLLLHVVDQGFHIPLLLVASCRGERADRDHAPEQVFFPQDIKVVLGIRRCRKECLELRQDSRTSNLLEQVPVSQVLGDRDQVDGLGLLPEFDQGCVDGAVGRMMEVQFINPLDGYCERVPG